MYRRIILFGLVSAIVILVGCLVTPSVWMNSRLKKSLALPGRSTQLILKISQRRPVVNEGNRIVLTATDEDGNQLSGLRWSSGSPDIAEVNSITGEVEGKKRGFATVTVTRNGQAASVFVTVVRVEKRKGEKVRGETRLDGKGQIYLSNPLQNVIMRADSALNSSFEVFAGSKNVRGIRDGLRSQSLFAGPTAIGIDNSTTGGVYIADTLNHSLRKITFTNEVQTIVGIGLPGTPRFDQTGTLSLSNLRLWSPRGVAVEAGGNLFLADTDNHAIYYLDLAAQQVRLVAGYPGESGKVDGPGSDARFFRPAGLTLSSDGRTLGVADEGNNRIRLIELARASDGSFSGQVTTIGVASSTRGVAIQSLRQMDNPRDEIVFRQPSSLSFDTVGNLNVVDQSGVYVVLRPLGKLPEVIELAQPGVTFMKPVSVSVNQIGSFVLDQDALEEESLKVVAVGAPRILSLSQDTARIDGGTEITITGENFAPESIVTLGNTPISDVNVVSATEIRFRVPPQFLPGERALSVQNRGEISQAKLTIIPKRLDEMVTGEASFIVGGAAYNGDGARATDPSVSLETSLFTVDTLGNIYTADGIRIRRIDADTRIVTTIVGGDIAGSIKDGGPARAARLVDAHDVVLDRAGNLFISDNNGRRIRRVDALTGIITTVVGGGRSRTDGTPADKFLLVKAQGLTIDQNNRLYFEDLNQIFSLNPDSQIIQLVAGTGQKGSSGDGGPATQATFNFNGVIKTKLFTLDQAGNLFIADVGNYRVRRIDAASGVITTVAGNGYLGYSGDGGPATNARMTPKSIALDKRGNLVIGEYPNRGVRSVDLQTGILSTLLTPEFLEAGGPPEVIGIQLDGNDNIYIGSKAGIWRFDAQSQRLTLIAGAEHPRELNLEELLSFNTRIPSVRALNVDSDGKVYLGVSSGVLQVTPETGRIAQVAGTGTPGFDGDGGPSEEANLAQVNDLHFLPNDNLLISDLGNPALQIGPRVRLVDRQTNIISTVAGNGSVVAEEEGTYALQTPVFPTGITTDPTSNLIIGESYRIRQVDSRTGILTTLARTHELGGYCQELAADGGGNIFVISNLYSTSQIRRIDAQTKTMTHVAGNRSTEIMTDGVPATETGAGWITDLAIDADGNLYLCSPSERTVRRVDARTGIITTLPRDPVVISLKETLGDLLSIVFDQQGNLYQLYFNGFVRVVKGVGRPGKPGIGPIGKKLSDPQPQISSLTIKENKLTLTGDGLDKDSLVVKINQVDVSSRIKRRTETKLILKGTPAQLSLIPGMNTIQLVVNGFPLVTYPFQFTVNQP
ncbi:MAG: IPT/TIG domain-containing protein [Acidobacteria bacterium]|nr:IPT/TIG domain-containing protein [Acidobacteriota bacterium]